jgi:glycosyltransferase involved in cell wall biosynthesis
MEKLPLSVALISFNEEDRIGRTLEAVRDIASEIIVVDSGSTDNTLKIAESFGAKCYTEDWKGFEGQRNSALEKCSGDWILLLDCDEVVSAELAENIENEIKNPRAEGYYLQRRSHYLGKLLKNSWYPDKVLRLIKKSAGVKWVGYNVHDKMEIDGNKAVLAGDLIHYSYRDLNDHYSRMVKYARQSAEYYQKSGRRFRWYNLLLNPINAFVRMFIIERAFADGVRGFLAAWSSLAGTFMKYAFLFELEQKNENDK